MVDHVSRRVYLRMLGAPATQSCKANTVYTLAIRPFESCKTKLPNQVSECLPVDSGLKCLAMDSAHPSVRRAPEGDYLEKGRG